MEFPPMPSRTSTARPRRVRRPVAESLEPRWLMAGNVPAGIYTEDFQVNGSPLMPAFDVGGAFQHEIHFGSTTKVITDPSDVGSFSDGYSLFLDGVDRALFLIGAEDHITFPNLVPGVVVNFASVEIRSIA